MCPTGAHPRSGSRSFVALTSLRRSYLLAEGPGALYVAFIGTKQPRDLLADVNAVQAPLWEAAAPAHGERAASNVVDAAAAKRLPRCHRGFLTRARAIPIVHLYDEARRRRRRLVLCGHSLGGAVAAVSAVRLMLALRALPGERPGGTAADDALAMVRVISFAQPPVGDAALRQLVRSAGWEGLFRTVVRSLVLFTTMRLLLIIGTDANTADDAA